VTRDALHDVESGSHLVHFYADAAALAASVADYVADGRLNGQAAVVIAEPRNLSNIRSELLARRLVPSPEDAAASAGTAAAASTATAKGPGPVVLLDAAATLSRILQNGRPDRRLFDRVVGTMLRDAGVGANGIRVYGEMVALLWRGGDVSGALLLEELWNELARQLPFSLYCGYPEALVAEPAGRPALDATCRLHGRVFAEGALAGRTSAHRRFDATPKSPASARDFAVQALGIDDPAKADEVAMVVTELTTNAVVHVRSGFSVDISRVGSTVRIVVRDDGEALPEIHIPADDGLSGRGLCIVDALARAWGTSSCYHGKVVWAEVDGTPDMGRNADADREAGLGQKLVRGPALG
jgi:hypothetical protein